MHDFGFKDYLSPFTWRYASREMRDIFSEKNYRLLWRRVWVALAQAQFEAGIVSKEELAELKAHENDIDLKKSHAIEVVVKHDVVAEIKAFAEQCPKGGGKIHLGATSMDVVDNADVLRMRQAMEVTKARVASTLFSLKKLVDANRETACMAYTHLQPAEPTTLGYRFAFWAQDLLSDLNGLEALVLRGKGFKGAVGTSASYAKLLQGKTLIVKTKSKGKHSRQKLSPQFIEERALHELGLEAFEVTTQTYPRKQDLAVANALACVAQSLHKAAFDIRLLQNPLIGELSEPFGRKQVGSSAMPFKKNPIYCERICSLTRFVSVLPQVAWNNAALSALERTLDDSANRRLFLPQAFLATDEALIQAQKVFSGLKIDFKRVRKNLECFSAFAGTEALLMELVEKGASRQQMHDLIRLYAFDAWKDVEQGKLNPLPEMLSKDKRITSFIPSKIVRELLDGRKHVGDAAERCKPFSKELGSKLAEYRKKLSAQSKRSRTTSRF